MIINNVIIGMDMYGAKLECGDICNFTMNVGGDVKTAKGMIVYDESTYSFAFEMLDDNFPIILMSHTEGIKKIFNARYLDKCVPDAEKWVAIYNNNLLTAKLD